jgi:uncharacterized Tic20 family protein
MSITVTIVLALLGALFLAAHTILIMKRSLLFPVLLGIYTLAFTIMFIVYMYKKDSQCVTNQQRRSYILFAIIILMILVLVQIILAGNGLAARKLSF